MLNALSADGRAASGGASSITRPLLLFALCMMLVTIGILAVYSSSGSTNYLRKQLIYAGAGLASLMICYVIDYRHLRALALPICILSFVLCLLVYVPGLGLMVKGARRWIAVGGFTLQPSEFAKLGLVIYMAKMLADRYAYRGTFFSGLFPSAVITGLFAGVIVLEPDFGAMAVVCAIVLGMWIAAEIRILHIIGLGVFTAPAIVFAFFSEEYRWRRMVAFLFKDKETLRTHGYQLHQSLIAVGSGNWWGLGLGESHQKFHFLTEAHTDFIFAIMAEELGFVRMTAIILLFAAITLVGWSVALRSTDLFGSLLAAGITLMFFVCAAINIGVVLGLLPTKGLVLPFISAGGSSLIANMAAMGILMNIAREHHVQDRSVSGML